MPTYSYECKKCAHVREVYHPMSADPSVKCEECGGAMRRLIGAGAGIIFKGTGFYETDYKTKNGGGAKGGGKANGDSKSETKSDSKSEGKSESKSEAQSETKSSAKSESTSSSSSKST